MQAVDSVKSLAERTGIDHFMFESMSLPDVDAMLNLVSETLMLVDRG